MVVGDNSTEQKMNATGRVLLVLPVEYLVCTEWIDVVVGWWGERCQESQRHLQFVSYSWKRSYMTE